MSFGHFLEALYKEKTSYDGAMLSMQLVRNMQCANLGAGDALRCVQDIWNYKLRCSRRYSISCQVQIEQK